MEIVKGEMLRPTLGDDLAATEKDYLAKIRGKTAALLAMCCQTGAMLDADDPELAGRMHRYGMQLGMAFQIVDDILDYTASQAQLGKPVGNDLRQGTITLPAIYYLQEHPRDKDVASLLAGEIDEAVHLEAVVDRVRRSGATTRALAEAQRYAAAALAEISTLSPGPYTTALKSVARYVVERRD
jgi:geranylgeranyl pyrophosphate synthase